MTEDRAHEVKMIEEPPKSVFGILGRLGPGLIVAGSIVGSGELIATTKTGAEAGFWLLWLIIIGCVIKVFTQVEFGRYSIADGATTMSGMNQVPGPTLELTLTGRAGAPVFRGNWLVWYWFLMFLASIAQLGGIVGGVGQALAISVPLTASGREFNAFVDVTTQLRVKSAELSRLQAQRDAGQNVSQPQLEQIQARIDHLNQAHAQSAATLSDRLGAEQFERLGRRPPSPPDAKYWATLIAVVTAVLLAMGRYGMIQLFATAMVASFTLITVVNLAMLQANVTWQVSWSDLWQGLSFRLPPVLGDAKTSGLGTALATFGIIGVGASELVTYPYWCLEKGYARFTGPSDASQAWADRARGWMRVMRWDAWCSMVVYTFATVAFYLLGAAILGRTGLNPAGDEMIRTLAVMYEPVFGPYAPPLFLFGAFAVLYSTYFVANASHARVFSDALRVLGFARQANPRSLVRLFSGLFPLLCLAIYIAFPAPAQLVLLSGLMQAIMLPMLAAAALYFRYYRCDARLRPGRCWDVFLWISAAGMLVAGGWALLEKIVGWLQ
ncbi:MAG: Nramp family divalent metal transporter [Pirellulaceae bacterium]|nr:Nramp family divalent metal transporter [Pirellulaceae bacterium]